MNIFNKKNMLAILGGLTLMGSIALPASAQIDAGLGVSANIQAAGIHASTTFMSSTTIRTRGARMASTTNPQTVAKIVAQSNTEISARITSLNNLITRVQAMKKVSASEIATIVAQLQTEISNLNDVKVKISADTDVSALRTDLKSVTADYRIYALVLPQTQIIAASDRIDTIASDFATITAKLQARISADQAAGKDVSTLSASLSDLQAKIADAQTQAQNAVSGVVSLVPDQGDQTVMAANTAALKAARADIKTATTDLVTARNDAESIIKAVEAFHVSATASTTVQAQ